MVAPSELRDYLQLTLENSGQFDEIESYITHEADPDGKDGNLYLPLIEIRQIDFDREDLSNSTSLGPIYDDNGEQVGEAYQSLYSATLQIAIWVASGSDHDVDELGDRLRMVLFNYDTRGPAKPITDDSGREIDSIYNFKLLSSSREDDLSRTPSVRMWQQNVSISAAEEYIDMAREATIKRTNLSADNRL